MTSNLYLGIMSGTSLDGVDLALVDFSEKHSPKMLATDFEPMPNDLRTTLSDLIKSGETNLQTLGELDHRLGLLYADCVNRFLQKSGFPAQQIQVIGCHGQTVWHAPQSVYPFTMQIGDMHLLASKTGITTVGDFRRKDMAVGGQGAPLVPAFHEAIFAQKDRLTVVLNIGGISNISVLNPNQPTIGYDVGVGNALMDSWIERHQGKRYDKNGDWAKTGEVLPDLLARLLDEPFFRLPPPKSTGRELFNLAWLEQKIGNADYKPQDVQRTLAEFTVQSIANALRPLATTAFEQSPRLLVCGGGARNPLLMDRLATLCPTWLVATTTDFGWDIDFVEAAAFAWLAHQRMVGLPSNLPSVTGAKQAVSLGGIFPKN